MTTLTPENRPAAREGRRQLDLPPEPSLPSHCCNCEKSGCLWRGGCRAYQNFQSALARRYEQEHAANAAA